MVKFPAVRRVAFLLAVLSAVLIAASRTSLVAAPPEIEQLIKQLRDKDEAVRLKAAKELGRLKEKAKDAIPALTEATKDADEDVREVAKKALAAIKGAAPNDLGELAPLVKDLKAKDFKVRLKALEALEKKGEDAKEAAKPICEAIVMDQNPKVALAALTTLEKVRPDLYKHVSVIALDRERTNLLAAYEGLAKLGAKAEATTPLLYAKLRAAMAGENLYLGENVAGGFPGPPGRGRAPSEDAEFYLSVLKRISPDDTEIIKTYKFLAGPLNTNNLRRLSALKVLVEWAGDEKDRRKEVYPFIKAGLVDRNTVLDCIKYVGGFGELAKDAVPILKQLKLSDEKTIRDAATKAVELIENP